VVALAALAAAAGGGFGGTGGGGGSGGGGGGGAGGGDVSFPNFKLTHLLERSLADSALFMLEHAALGASDAVDTIYDLRVALGAEEVTTAPRGGAGCRRSWRPRRGVGGRAARRAGRHADGPPPPPHGSGCGGDGGNRGGVRAKAG